ncbi:MAG TPA: UvrD-helicase domain-containing protein [Paludibacteraceae bacterium]|nr:UvrD-helicase domain-containing protein [Paludibacteraceae bacterium]
MVRMPHNQTIQLYKASAGSGKTYRLSYTYIALLFQHAGEKHPHRNTLAVTFTNKATDEMKRRIISELFKLSTAQTPSFLTDLQKDFPHLTPEAIQKQAASFLADLLHDYSGFNVSTIDKFFQQIVRAFTREIGLQGNFSVELDEDKVLQYAIDMMLFELDKSENKSLLNWLTEYAEEQLKEGKSWKVSNNINQLGREIFKESYLQNLVLINEQLHDKDFLRTYQSNLRAIIDKFEKEMHTICNKAVAIVQKHGLSFDNFNGGSRSFAFLFNFDNLKNKGFELTATFINIATADDITKWYTKSSPAHHKESIASAFNEGLGDCAKQLAAADRINYLSAKVAINNLYMLGVLLDIGAQIKRYCDENNTMLIGSTTEFIHRIMEGCDTPFIYEKTGVNIHHYMIDEFQDTSQLQWNNFQPLLENSVAENHQNLIVGDVKQSIYRFRNSDWSLLQSVVESAFPKNVTKTTLDTNWRSAKNIVLFNNTLFQLAPNLLATHFENDKSKSTLIEIYKDGIQKNHKSTGGRVAVHFITEDKELKEKWKDNALKRLPETIDQLLAQGYSQSDITILVHKNDEATQIADFLLNCEGKQYDIISNEALLIANAPQVKLLVAIMRFFVTPDDKVNRILIELLYKNSSQTVQFIDNETAEEWGKRLFGDQYDTIQRLKNEPLFQLIEGLIQLLNLHDDSNNVVFLQAFQDEIYQFASKENADINGFLSYWDEFSAKKFLSASEAQDAIRIMTIHKSKGLEFKAVIIPFCDWELDSGRPKSILWCKPDSTQEPFSQLSIIPVNYTLKLKETIFAHDYWDEKLKRYIDTLNMTYVAFTRAENELIIMAPKTEKELKNQNVAQILQYVFTKQASIELDPTMTLSLDTVNFTDDIVIGEASPFTPNRNQNSIKNRELTYDSVSLMNRIKLRYNLNDSGSERKKGILMHRLLSQITTLNDICNVLKKAVLSGEIRQNEMEEIDKILQSLFQLEQVKEWFSGKYKVLNEAEIITPQGTSYRPDRLMIKDQEVIVVDYKFGQQKEAKYKRQLGNYLQLIRKMGYNATGYILYATLGEIESA